MILKIRQNKEIAFAIDAIIRLNPRLGKESEVFQYAFNQVANDICDINWGEISSYVFQDVGEINFSPTRTITISDNDFNLIVESFRDELYLKRVNYAFLTKLVLLYTRKKLERKNIVCKIENNNETNNLFALDLIKNIIYLLENNTEKNLIKINEIVNILKEE